MTRQDNATQVEEISKKEDDSRDKQQVTSLARIR